MNGLNVPRAPAALKQRVLQAATSLEAQPQSIWDRLWQSRLLRVAWTVTTAGLLLANVWLSVSRPRSTARDVAGAREQIERLREDLGLTEFAVTPRAEAMVMELESNSVADDDPRG